MVGLVEFVRVPEAEEDKESLAVVAEVTVAKLALE